MDGQWWLIQFSNTFCEIEIAMTTNLIYCILQVKFYMMSLKLVLKTIYAWKHVSDCLIIAVSSGAQLLMTHHGRRYSTYTTVYCYLPLVEPVGPPLVHAPSQVSVPADQISSVVEHMCSCLWHHSFLPAIKYFWISSSRCSWWWS